MKTYYAYIRVSTTKQGEGVSLEAQQEAIQQYANRHNLIISQWFEEKETAAKVGRRVFNQMVNGLKDGQANGLIVHKIDRSSRNFRDWALIGDLADVGIDVHFATESLDFNSRGGRLAADIQAVVAADYIRNLREESTKGQRTRLRQGYYPYCAPIGYLNNGKGKHKTICPIHGPLVKQMFELYAAGTHSIRSLTEEMHHRGLTTRKGRKVAKTTIEEMLKNPFYYGLIKIKKTGQTYEGGHEPLISPELFQAATEQRVGGRSVQKQTKHNHTYRGLWRCGLCEQAMVPEQQRGRVYYRCQNRDCPTKCIPEGQIETTIAATLKNRRLTAKQANELKRRVKQHLQGRDRREAEEFLNADMAKLAVREQRLNDKLLDDLIDDEAYKIMKENIATARLQVQKKLTDLRQNTISDDQLSDFLERAKSLYVSYISANPSEKREIVKCATSNRRVRGKKLYLEPQNWLSGLENAEVSVLVAHIRSWIDQGKLPSDDQGVPI